MQHCCWPLRQQACIAALRTQVRQGLVSWHVTLLELSPGSASAAHQKHAQHQNYRCVTSPRHQPAQLAMCWAYPKLNDQHATTTYEQHQQQQQRGGKLYHCTLLGPSGYCNAAQQCDSSKFSNSCSRARTRNLCCICMRLLGRSGKAEPSVAAYSTHCHA